MKICKRLIIVFVFALVLGIAAFTSHSGRKPFKDLKSAEIASATVRLTPPDKTIQIVELEELVDYLNDVVIYDQDDSYTEYSGQGVIFTLTMTDGTRTEIMAYNPFLAIDRVGYKTAYKPCEALNRYANRLLNEEDAMVIIGKPPALDIICDNACNGSLLGTYSWQRRNDDGSFTDINADSAHPLACKDLLFQIETTETTAMLHFTDEPDTIINVCCWSDAHWEDYTVDSENVSVNGNEIELKPGGYIYEITAEWDTEKTGFGGIARYSFYVKALLD